MKIIKSINVCALFLLISFYGIINASDWYSGVNFGKLHGKIVALQTYCSEASSFSYIKIDNTNSCPAEVYPANDPRKLSTKTQGSGLVSIKNSDKQMLATVLLAMQNASVVDVYLYDGINHADANGYNQVEFIQTLP
jgi:hypothetical protein